jgi:hypothetical protein
VAPSSAAARLTLPSRSAGADVCIASARSARNRLGCPPTRRWGSSQRVTAAVRGVAVDAELAGDLPQPDLRQPSWWACASSRRFRRALGARCCHEGGRGPDMRRKRLWRGRQVWWAGGDGCTRPADVGRTTPLWAPLCRGGHPHPAPRPQGTSGLALLHRAVTASEQRDCRHENPPPSPVKVAGRRRYVYRAIEGWAGWWTTGSP